MYDPWCGNWDGRSDAQSEAAGMFGKESLARDYIINSKHAMKARLGSDKPDYRSFKAKFTRKRRLQSSCGHDII